MDVKQRITELMQRHGWSEYRLAKESGLSISTISNMFNRNTLPSISTLQVICDSFGISLAQFFSEGTEVELSKDQQELFSKWRFLTAEQKELILQLIDNMKWNAPLFTGHRARSGLRSSMNRIWQGYTESSFWNTIARSILS